MTLHNKKNLFEIWRDNGEDLPFAAWIDSWHRSRYVIVDEIKIQRWPYGTARGYPTNDGIPSDLFDGYPEWRSSRTIPNAGVYRWEHVPVVLENGIYVRGKNKEPKTKPAVKPRILTCESKLTFGKYKGMTVGQVASKDPGYLNWAVLNVESLVVDPIEFDRLIGIGTKFIPEAVKANSRRFLKLKGTGNDAGP